MRKEPRFNFLMLSSMLCIILTPVFTSAVSAQRLPIQRRNVFNVQHSVVRIETFKDDKPLSTGSGFVVDSKGLIVTNYNTIKGADKVVVSFPFDVIKKKYPASGFTAVNNGMDLALININPKGKTLAAAPLAEEKPKQGEFVTLYGGVAGLTNRLKPGTVKGIHTGEQLHEMLKTGEKDPYKEVLGFDDDLTWIQTSAAIGDANIGGPMANAKGEVIGINKFAFGKGSSMYFALSAIDIKKFIEATKEAKAEVQPFDKLPKPDAEETKDEEAE